VLPCALQPTSAETSAVRSSRKNVRLAELHPHRLRGQGLLGLKGLHGITDEQIEVHLKLYNGYVNRTNALLAKVAKLANDGQHADSSYQELKRRAGWEWNGMRLHEYYFDNLGASRHLHARGEQPFVDARRRPCSAAPTRGRPT
jgi:hypothetical protein